MEEMEMRKYLCYVLVLVAMLMAVVLSGCELGAIVGGTSAASQGSGNESNDVSQNPENESGDVNQGSEQEPNPRLAANGEWLEVEAYRPPTRLFNLNLNTDDPSNNDIRFVFDDEERIRWVYYSIDDFDVVLAYSYDEHSILIIGFINEIVVAYEEITASAGFDKSLGFIEYKGYYFYGFSF
jgi:hypothetical protein